MSEEVKTNNLGDYLKTGGPGRVKGSKNKITKTIKEAVKLAFDEAGGHEYLLEVAKKDPKTFVQLVAKLIPQEVTGDTKTTLRIITGIQRDTPSEESE
ncbi:hypothetical protein [Phyllobacterium sophorae]|uniref:DUF5681 domain-containing protein n=1 Tax=Phyllobacterium sophorae TaxID=1520277 RepID=A0A2P7BDW5_9HYPH|nr:hypothetical protein [Phyllobacterium sophorae]PSH64670.1 hypothetical protein CU103_12365 [Phyllobacterium sophorae]